MPDNIEKRLPGEGLEDWQAFDLRVDGEQKSVGFKDPDGNYYPLGEGEELVHIKKADDMGRDTFIRKDGTDIPFEEWKESQRLTE